MDKILYRIVFGVILGTFKVVTIKNIVVQLPEELAYTDLELKILEKKSFKEIFKYGDCERAEDVSFISAALIPDTRRTKEIKPDLVIEGADWPSK